MKASKAVIECLLEQGVDTIFGYPGGMNLPLYDALYDEKRLKHILTTHEQNAAHAADGYARATGKVGVCTATSGPGATNLVTGIGTAFMDSIPIVAITGQVDSHLLGRDAFQEVDILDITIPITKHNFKIKKPEALIPAIRDAFKIAKEGRPGPVLIDVPRDMFFADIEYVPQAPAKEDKATAPDPEFLSCVDEAAEIIRQATAPVVIAGGGIISANASPEFIRFIDKFNLPVANTLMGIGALPAEKPQALGFAGLHGNKTANNAIAESDLIIAVGSRFGDRQTGSIAKYASNTRFIHIDVDPAEINKNVSSSIGLAGDMKTILTILTAHEGPTDLTDWWSRIHSWQEEFSWKYESTPFNVPWVMHHIAQETAHKPYAYATDVGQHQMWAAQHLRLSEPRTWFTSGGLGTMGFGLPASMGAQIAFGSKRRLIHIAGDGGIKMTGNEYYTIARLNLPIISIIINNQSLGMIHQLQKVFYQEHYSSCMLPQNMDYIAYANCFGIEAASASTAEEFTACFKHACESNKPQVIVVNVPSAFVEPMMRGGVNDFVDFH
jgi:acetolactate synthase-1/2/3 large subunit